MNKEVRGRSTRCKWVLFVVLAFLDFQAIQTLSSFAVGENALAGIVLGYGGIATTDIQEGLRRLGKCFGQLEPGGTTTPL